MFYLITVLAILKFPRICAEMPYFAQNSSDKNFKIVKAFENSHHKERRYIGESADAHAQRQNSKD